jgi:hypothetical protein
MASGYNAGRFNLALACAAAGATAFALFALPDAEFRSGLEAVGLAQILSDGTVARFAIGAAAPILAFLLVWLTLRSCDPPVRQAGTDKEEDNWPLSLLVSGHGSDTDSEDPFAALARGAERVDDCFEFARAQSEAPEIALAIGDQDDAVPEPVGLLARLPYAAASHANDAVQQLDTGHVASEWPLPPGESEEAAEEMEDRLRHVLLDLKLVARRG